MAIPGWACIADAAALGRRLVDEVTPLVAAAVGARGMWSLAIPGGSAAEVLVPELLGADLPWDCAHLFWCDERAVPPGDPQSNWHLFQRLWEEGPRRGAPMVHRMNAEALDPEAATAAYERELEKVAGDFPVLDLVLLGVGEDGHVASLFPGHEAVEERTRRVVFERASPKPPAHRMTLTLPVLAGARLTCVAAFGEGKRRAMRAMWDGTKDLPVARVLRAALHPLLLLDPAAGAGLADQTFVP